MRKRRRRSQMVGLVCIPFNRRFGESCTRGCDRLCSVMHLAAEVDDANFPILTSRVAHVFLRDLLSVAFA